MSGYSPYDKTPGKSSGVTAADVAATPDVGTMAPGRKNLVQSTDVGDPWIDGGAKCDAPSADPGCYLPHDKRERLITDFKIRVVVAQTNFKLALEQMRVDELVKKDDDVNWALGLVLDVASLYIGGSTTRALTKVAGKKVSETMIQAAVKTGFDKAKTGVKSGAKAAASQEAHAETTASLSYIKQLEAGCDVAFGRFASGASAIASDAELVVLWEGMDPQYHTIELYKTELTKKLSRYKESGVPDIGSKRIAGEGFGPKFYEARRVVWVRGASGERSLYFQVAQGITPVPFSVEGGEMTPVPAEFTDAALAQHAAQWGAVPTIDNPAVAVASRLTQPERKSP